ncbi:Salicylate hydroxylase [Mycena indigotica]|uniref:Salicylate hydroxylase n=1 Tax=Mycena indigotica TaxID=2126181 RepID=A0A8H6S884_9AGAR|nr:Salicylate hydroxylase [Mycena indigotica]KAF7294726.1 Salicylate hydroxylase [Mycena indigotica]
MASVYTTEKSNKDFRVAIVGGGMTGLACAVGLARFGIHCDIFEAAPKFDEVGAGVGLGPNALRALEGLGLLDAVLANTDEAQKAARRMLYISGIGDHEQVYDYETCSTFTDADRGIGIFRPAFLSAVLPLLPDPKVTHFNKRCTSISASSAAYSIHFADGSTHEADLVIGADGIRSTTRAAVVGDKKVLKFTNTSAYRGLVPLQTLIDEGIKTDMSKRVLNFVGIDKHIISFPIRSGQIINVVAFATDNSVPVGSVEVNGPWVQPASQQELLDRYEGWGPDVMIILKQLKTPNKWYIHTLAPLETFVKGKVALIGDAAHGMVPHLGSGAGQGFEDVYVLCQLLGHPATNISNLEDVLKAYDAVRQPRANMVLSESLRSGVICESFGLPGYGMDDMEGHLANIWDPIWRHDLDGDVLSALVRLGWSS